MRCATFVVATFFSVLSCRAGAADVATVRGNFGVTGVPAQGVALSVEATGTDQATAKVLTLATNVVGVVPPNSGVRLPVASSLSAGLATTVEIWNTSGTKLLVYPAPGESFNGTLPNKPLYLGPNKRMRFLYMGVGAAWSAARDSLVYGPANFGAPPGALEFVFANNVVPPPGRLLSVPAGDYVLDARVYTTGYNAWLFERGATLSGERLDAVTDTAALNASGLTLARMMSSIANEHGLFVSSQVNPTTGTSRYQKAGVYSRSITLDPSSYTGFGGYTDEAVLRDAVAIEGQAGIEKPNLFGRAWGINTGAGPLQPGADGYAVGGEFSITSESNVAAGALGTPTSKIAVHAVAFTRYNPASTATAAFAMSGNGTTFQDGIVATQEALNVGAHAFSVRPITTSPFTPKTRDDDVAYIGRDGTAMFAGLRLPTASTPASSSAACTTGAVAWDASYLYLCVASGAWKRAPLATW